MSIRLRLFLGFAIVICLMVGLTLFALYQMKGTKDRLDWIVDVSAKNVEIAQTLKKDVLYFTVLEKNALLVPNFDEKKVFIGTAEQAAKEVEYRINQLRNVVSDDMNDDFVKFLDQWNLYLGTSREVLELAQNQSREQAIVLSQGLGKKSFDYAVSILQTLVLLDGSLVRLPEAEQEAAENVLDVISSLALQIEVNIVSMQDSEKKLVVAHTKREIRELTLAISNSQANVDEFLGKITDYVIRENIRLQKMGVLPQDDIRWFEKEWIIYRDKSVTVRDLIAQNTAQRARKLSIEKGEPELAQVIKLLDSIISRNEKTMLADKLKGQYAYEQTRILLISVVLVSVCISVLVGFYLSRSITKPLLKLVQATGALAKGDTSVRSNLDVSHEMQSLSESFDVMAKNIDDRVWLQTELNRVSIVVRGTQDRSTLANNVINVVTERLHVPVGAVYLEEEGLFSLAGRYGLTDEYSSRSYRLGEGLIGQVALEGKVKTFEDITLDARVLSVDTGLPNVESSSTVVQPLIRDDVVVGVIVLGVVRPLTSTEYTFLQKASETIAVSVSMEIARKVQAEYLEATQKQATNLQFQQKALAEANHKLEHTNNELEGKRSLLEEQKVALEDAKKEVESKADELRSANTYKSEFLANMSHELRTPLNSLLLLSKSLVKNSEDNLTDEQMKSLAIIYNGGHELLSLINDILDLSKVEAGKLDIYHELFSVKELFVDIEVLFNPIAEEAKIALKVDLAEDIPSVICSDKKRIVQIVRNLMSNAFKFTEDGCIQFDAYIEESRPGNKFVVFEVTDTGVGIPKEKQELIFESFQQADGTTSRQYGGTGLGLAISRELARLISGYITLDSEVGKGSTFKLFIPLVTSVDEAIDTGITVSEGDRLSLVQDDSSNPIRSIPVPMGRGVVVDDRFDIRREDKKILIVEDDLNFASILRDLARERGFKVVVSPNGEKAVALAIKYLPDIITLDVGLPGIDGTEVLRQLRNLPATSNVPIYVITSDDSSSVEVSAHANGFFTKPVSQEDVDSMLRVVGSDAGGTREPSTVEQEDGEVVTEDVLVASLAKKRVLIVDDDIRNMFALSQLLKNYDIDVLKADNGQLALDRLDQNEDVDLILMDIMMPIMNGYEAMEKIRIREDYGDVPIIALTAQTTRAAFEKCAEAGANGFLTKPVDEQALFLRMHYCLNEYEGSEKRKAGS